MYNRYLDQASGAIDITQNGKLVPPVVKYPEVPLSSNDLYVYTTIGDTFITLANQFYQDSTLWWVISIANTGTTGTNLTTDLPQDSIYIPVGTQLRIPSNPINIVNLFKLVNSY